MMNFLMSFLGFFSGREIQQRWANLRSCFAREMREQKKGTSGQAAQKRRKYVYFDQLLFLLPTVEERETESNLEPPESCLDQEDSLVPSEPPAVEQTPRPPPSTGRPKKKTTSYEQSLLDILKEKSDKREEIDEDKTFALSLVPALKRLSFEKKFEAKMEIMGVLHRLSRAPPAPTQHNVNVPLYQAYATLTAPGASYDGGNVSYHQRCRTPYAQTSGTPSPSSSFQSVSNLNEQSPTSEFY